jgi:hypothetical protein
LFRQPEKVEPSAWEGSTEISGLVLLAD